MTDLEVLVGLESLSKRLTEIVRECPWLDQSKTDLEVVDEAIQRVKRYMEFAYESQFPL